MPPVERDGRPTPRWINVGLWLGTLAIAAWSLRFLVTGEIPPGNDITGHLQRADFGLGTLWRHGQVDGWYPQSMLGYQLHLFYGPGLNLAIAAVRVASFGLLSNPGALSVVLGVSIAAVAPATYRLARALGLTAAAAGGAAVVSLAVGSTRGGGIDGTFNTGLAAQQVAIPLVIVALAQIADRVRVEADTLRPPPWALAVTVAAVAFTHPLSLVILALLAPLVVLVVWVTEGIDFGGVRSLVVAAGAAIVLSAAWWLPALAHRSLRGPVTSFTLPGVVEHIRMLAQGERGWRGSAGGLAAFGVVTGFGFGVGVGHRRLIALGALPLAAFGLLHLTHGVLGINQDLGRQLPNRGLIFVAILSALPMGMLAEIAVSAVTRRLPAGPASAATTAAVVVWLLAAGLAVQSLHDIVPPEGDRYRPTPALVETAAVLNAEVPDGAAFITVGTGANTGVPDHARWLAWRSDTHALNLFGPEYAPGSGAVGVALAGPGTAGVDAWLDQTQLLAVSHIVSADPAMTTKIGTTPRLERIAEHENLVVWAIVPTPGHPVASVVPADSAEVITADAEHIRVTVTEADREVRQLAIGYSPGWSATIDGRPVPVARSHDDRLQLVIDAGTHEVELRYREPSSGPTGRVISLVGVVGIIAAVYGRRRRTRSEPVADTGSKSIDNARK